MDWNLNTPTEWNLENLDSMYTNKVDNIVNSSSEETLIKTFGVFHDLPNDFLQNIMVKEATVLSGSTSSSNNKTATKSAPLFRTTSPIIKRPARASYLSYCQVEGCNLDLSSAKDYHRRHRICSNHSKSPKVIVGGMERRFCQQCSRLHDLSEFDDVKRSCRRRLSAHNARRRRLQSEDIHFNSTWRSSSICDRRPHEMNFLLNRSVIPILDSAQPQLSRSFKGKESVIGDAKSGGIDVFPINGTLNFSSERFMSRTTNINGMEQPSSNLSLPGDVNYNAFSLLSTSSWSSGWPGETSSFDQFVHGNNISLGIPLELQNITSNDTQLQDFQSLRSSHEFERF